MMIRRLSLMTAVLMLASLSSVQAQESPVPATTAAGMDSMPGMDHSNMNSGGMADTGRDAEPAMEMMDHGEGSQPAGRMQGGPAPADARSPDYSDGYDFGKIPRPVFADEQNFASLLADRMEGVWSRDNSSAVYDVQAWFGRDYNRAVLKAEGDINSGRLEDAQTELLWGHAIATYWDTQLGMRYDSGDGPNRSWLAFGLQGLAPYWFEIDTTAYVGEQGRTALGLEAEYELLFTQKLILQTRVEADVYGKSDIERGLGSGLSDMSLGLRLRYEIRREIAPYLGVEWARKFGETGDLARDAGLDASETRYVAGLRFWF